MTELHSAEITFFSRAGHTPLTNRGGGGFCDKLSTVTVSVVDGCEARKVATDMKADIPHASTAFFNVPDHPNQNTRNGWV